MGIEATVKVLEGIFKDKIAELQEEPAFQWGIEKTKYAVDENGSPSIKLSIMNTALDYDLWRGLRNPAFVGFIPCGFTGDLGVLC